MKYADTQVSRAGNVRLNSNFSNFIALRKVRMLITERHRLRSSHFLPTSLSPLIHMRTALKLFAAGSVALLIAVVSMSYSIGTGNVPSVSAASDYFLKLDGVADTIEINSWSWGATNTAPRDSASGQSTGKRQYQPIIIRKRIDKATPLLFKASNDGKRYKTVTLTRGSYTVTFFDVFVTGFQHEGVAGSEPTESVTFTYQKIEMK